MPKIQQKPALKRQPCIGDLTQQVRLLTREIIPPLPGETDHSYRFQEVAKPWAKVTTKTGKTFWDGASNAEIPITHELEMYFRADVDVQSWFELPSGSRVRVLNVENYDERDTWMRLPCTERGPESVPAAQI